MVCLNNENFRDISAPTNNHVRKKSSEIQQDA